MWSVSAALDIIYTEAAVGTGFCRILATQSRSIPYMEVTLPCLKGTGLPYKVTMMLLTALPFCFYHNIKEAISLDYNQFTGLWVQ